MSLGKAIQSGKEHRKQYRKSKLFDYSCRNHGSCRYCLSNRIHSTIKQILIAEDTKGE